MNKKRLNYLINQLKLGNKDVFDEFYNLTKIYVFYNIRKLTNDKELIEDIMQESYILFLNNLYKINENINPLSYLITISKNKTIDELRKLKHLDDEEPSEYIETTNDNSKYDFPLLYYCKTHLNDEEYKILELTIIEKYKRVEVAKMLNAPISTINWKYNQILKKVNTFYKEVYNEKNR